MTKLQILVIDDNPAVVVALELAFRIEGHDLRGAGDQERAFSLLARYHFDAILLDLNYEAGKSDGREGLACLTRILSDDPSACVVVLTAHGGMKTAVTAMQKGARDFVVKPWNNADLIAKVINARSQKPSVSIPSVGLEEHYRAPPLRLLGRSRAIEELRELIRRVGPTSAGVAVTGISGSGRTLVALLVHAASRDAGRPPLTLDLRTATAWQTLATAKGTVILRHAEKLDEVNQEGLLTALSEDIRPISILNDSNSLIPALRRRLATVVLRVPPLAQRQEDALLLARHFADDAAARFSRQPPVLSETALDAYCAAGWPDEVRGLALAVDRAVLLTDDGKSIDHLPIDQHSIEDSAHAPADGPEPAFDLNTVEKTLIERALTEYNHNVSNAARALGLSRGALYRRMERHGL